MHSRSAAAEESAVGRERVLAPRCQLNESSADLGSEEPDFAHEGR